MDDGIWEKQILSATNKRMDRSQEGFNVILLLKSIYVSMASRTTYLSLSTSTRFPA